MEVRASARVFLDASAANSLSVNAHVQAILGKSIYSVLSCLVFPSPGSSCGPWTAPKRQQ